MTAFDPDARQSFAAARWQCAYCATSNPLAFSICSRCRMPQPPAVPPLVRGRTAPKPPGRSVTLSLPTFNARPFLAALAALGVAAGALALSNPSKADFVDFTKSQVVAHMQKRRDWNDVGEGWHALAIGIAGAGIEAVTTREDHVFFSIYQMGVTPEEKAKGFRALGVARQFIPLRAWPNLDGPTQPPSGNNSPPPQVP